MHSKVIVVTGAAQGIGRAIADAFHSKGWQVAVMDKQAAKGP